MSKTTCDSCELEISEFCAECGLGFCEHHYPDHISSCDGGDGFGEDDIDVEDVEEDEDIEEDDDIDVQDIEEDEE